MSVECGSSVAMTVGNQCQALSVERRVRSLESRVSSIVSSVVVSLRRERDCQVLPCQVSPC